ncbi:MAG: phosphoribosylanthranilate isomerase [Puniceicoccales bacterium]|jgi:phosphoribosylanthranilate isomerase|nr:phosphoribosylanthranilate isomerase [Puniceicoccales bacterium]
MSFRVKVCGITRSADAVSALALGVDFLGINGWQFSPRFVADEHVGALLEAIPLGRRVFVDVEPQARRIAGGVVSQFDFVQLHFDPFTSGVRERVASWAEQIGRGRLWLAPRVAIGAEWPVWVLEYADTFLFDGHKVGSFGGTGRMADKAAFAALKCAHPEKHWILAGGLGPDTLETAAASGADFFDLNSGVEDAPGIKNAQKLAQALRVLRRCFAA